MTKHKPPVEKSQINAFRKAARELRADELKEGFQDVLRTIAKHKPATETKKPK